MAIVRDAEAVRRALQAGQITVLDPATGYNRSMHANCPGDDTPAGVYMTTRQGGGISAVTFRCPSCGRHFAAGPEEIYLR